MVRRVTVSAQIQRKLNVADLQAFVPKAAALEPGNDEVFRIHSHLSEVGNVEEAIKFEEQAIALDPLLANSQLSLGYMLYMAGRYAEAQAALQKPLVLNPGAVAVQVVGRAIQVRPP